MFICIIMCTAHQPLNGRGEGGERKREREKENKCFNCVLSRNTEVEMPYLQSTKRNSEGNKMKCRSGGTIVEASEVVGLLCVVERI